MPVSVYHQLNAIDCGPTCVRMIANFYGKHYNADTLRNIAGYSKEDVSLLSISETAERIGFRTRDVQLIYVRTCSSVSTSSGDYCVCSVTGGSGCHTLEGKEVLEYINGRLLTRKSQYAPLFVSTDMNGKRISLESYRGKYVLICFWAT
jgi:ABC-type bacteriocin/lantibiotic exporter with double-glycine peptidase domain